VSVFDSLLNNTFSVERRTRTGDGQGGWILGYASIGTTLGRIRPASGVERQVAMSEGREISHVLYVRHGGNIVARGDRVTCGDLVVEVLGLREPSKSGHHLEIDCLQREQETAIIMVYPFWPGLYWPATYWPAGYWAST
jgi:SPP1 family predicted phage head-tail adaptor